MPGQIAVVPLDLEHAKGEPSLPTVTQEHPMALSSMSAGPAAARRSDSGRSLLSNGSNDGDVTPRNPLLFPDSAAAAEYSAARESYSTRKARRMDESVADRIADQYMRLGPAVNSTDPESATIRAVAGLVVVVVVAARSVD